MDQGCRRPRIKIVWCQLVIVVISIKMQSQHDLFGTIHAINTLSLGFGLGKRRQQHRRQYGYDGNDNQQLNQSKSRIPRTTHFFIHIRTVIKFNNRNTYISHSTLLAPASHGRRQLICP